MSKRYTSEHKTAVLALLDANGGSVSLTAFQSGVPERTLRGWTKNYTQWQQHAHQLPPTPQRQEDESELPSDDEIGLLRTYVQQAALRIAAKLSADLDSPALYHKVSALNGLLDRLAKIENAFPKTKEPIVIRVERIPLPRPIDTALSTRVNDSDDRNNSRE